GAVATGRSSDGEAGGRGLTGLGRGLDGVVTRDRVLGDGEVGGEVAVLVRRDGHRVTDGVALRIYQLHLHLGARREVLTGHRGGVARVDGARIDGDARIGRPVIGAVAGSVGDVEVRGGGLPGLGFGLDHVVTGIGALGHR